MSDNPAARCMAIVQCGLWPHHRRRVCWFPRQTATREYGRWTVNTAAWVELVVGIVGVAVGFSAPGFALGFVAGRARGGETL